MMTRIAYNRSKEKIMAGTDIRLRERNLRWLEIACTEESDTNGMDTVEQQVKQEQKQEMKEYSSIFWAYLPELDDGHNQRRFLFVSDPNKDYVLAYFMCDVRSDEYVNLPENRRYEIEDWKAPEYRGILTKSTGICLTDDPEPIYDNEVTQYNIGHLAPADYRGVQRKLEVLGLLPEIKSGVNIFDRIDDIVAAVYRHYENNIATL
jgi:hypothetical protein